MAAADRAPSRHTRTVRVVVAVFDFTDLTTFPLPPGGSVVASDLLNFIITPAVDACLPGLGNIEVFQSEPGQSEGGGHAFALSSGGLVDVLVHGLDGVLEVIEAQPEVVGIDSFL